MNKRVKKQQSPMHEMHTYHLQF